MRPHAVGDITPLPDLSDALHRNLHPAGEFADRNFMDSHQAPYCRTFELPVFIEIDPFDE